mgnify:CR=1 FL=1
MAKLVDQERLAKLAKALDARMKSAVAGEKELRVAADEALQAAIDAINHEESGILALAKKYADAQDTVDKNAQALVDADFEKRISDIEAKFGDGEGTVEDMIEAVQSALDEFIEAQAKKDGEQDAAITAAQKAADDEADRAKKAEKDLQDAIDVLNGADTVEGSVAKAVKDAVDDLADRHDEEMDAAEGRLDALEGIVGKAATETEAATGLQLKVAQNTKAIADEVEARGNAVQAVQDKVDENAQAILTEKGRAEGQEAAIRQELVNEKLALQGEIDADVKVEADRAKAAEEALAGRLDVIEGEGEGSIKKAVQDLASRHDSEMDAVEGRVADLEGLFEGDNSVDAKIAAAKQEALDAVKDEEDRAKEVEEDHEGRIAANEAFVAAQPAIDAEQNRRIKVLEDDAPVKQAAIEAAQGAADAAQADVDAVEKRLDDEGGLVDRIEANEANIARLDGAVEVEGSVKKQIKDAIDVVNQAAEDLGDRVEALETFKDVTYPAAEAKVREDFAAADAQVLADAKKYADEEITKLVDSAPDAMNTLNELASAISANKGVYDAYVEQHAAAMTKMKEDLQKEIDDDVKVEADRAVAEEAKIRGEFAAADTALHTTISDEIDADVKAEADRAKAEEADIRADFAAADIALHATIKNEMAAVIQSLVAEITEDGMLRIALSGNDEVLVIKEQEIPFVTDAEIDEIIAGLDTPAGE